LIDNLEQRGFCFATLPVVVEKPVTTQH